MLTLILWCRDLWCLGFQYLCFKSGRGSCFSAFSISIRIKVSCSYSSWLTCPRISIISRSEKQGLFKIILVLLASLWLVSNLAYSSQISIILFLYLFVRYCSYSEVHYLSSLVQFFVELLLSSFFVYLKIEQPTFAGCLLGPSYLISREHMLIITLRSVI